MLLPYAMLFVRYGAVVYPMLETPSTRDATNLLKEFMEIVGFNRMIIQAAPGTLALTLDQNWARIDVVGAGLDLKLAGFTPFKRSIQAGKGAWQSVALVLRADVSARPVAAPAHSPEQIGIFLRARGQDFSGGIDHLHRQDAVAGEPEGAAQQPKAAAQRMARDPHGETASGRYSQMV